MSLSSETTENIVLPRTVAKAFWVDYGYRTLCTILLLGAAGGVLDGAAHLGWSGALLLLLLGLRIGVHPYVVRCWRAVATQPGQSTIAFTARQHAASELYHSGILGAVVLMGLCLLLGAPGPLVFLCVGYAAGRSTLTLYDAVMRRINAGSRGEIIDGPLHTPSDRSVYSAAALLLLFTLTQANPLSVLLCAGLVCVVTGGVLVVKVLNQVELTNQAGADQQST